jgi:threonine/homoserine/homoserine lactone efflux protein
MTGQVAFLSGMGPPLLALVLASLVIMGSPGPSTMSATAMGAAFGIRRSVKYVSGLIVGTMVVLLAVATGVVALLLSIGSGVRALNVLSGAYILYLAFRIATAPPQGVGPREMVAPAFAGGFLLAIANPKGWLAIGAVFAGSTVIANDPRLDAVVKTASLGGMIVVIHMFWLMTGASLSRALRDPIMSRVFNLTLAGILVVTTVVGFIG